VCQKQKKVTALTVYRCNYHYYYYYYYTHLMASFQDNLGKPIPERQNQSGFKRGKRRWGFGMAVASGGPNANNLHLVPDR